MNRIILSVLLLVFSLVIKGQDKIITNNNRAIEAVVIEQTPRFVSYKWFGMDNSPLFTVKTRQLERIEYRNGVVDYLGNLNPRRQKPLGVSAGVLMTVSGIRTDFYILSLDYFITPQIKVVLNTGESFYSANESHFTVGGQYHLNHKNSQTRLTPYIGALYGSEFGDAIAQFPLGINYIFPFGLDLSMSLSQQIKIKNNYQYTLLGLSLGWRFGVRN
ncbi:mitochondrial porin family protein [Alkalitalea saponilacus]|uniref:Outer membrane protein beta-barrel domain-containing protein n=1 Tax=Alkalitalea saponilacus TaxID=889453 RepID=A0A1T5HTI5_9BACT|nr:hypothetical protein [Alkalitalea saponilacus]ASB48533.1 hypothetical protein CDL62_04960 [Alkalitalea saponilacus]SKC23841.1 hypothetical protein SAMN03080601_03126 [Alkalitalea saponilacus]